MTNEGRWCRWFEEKFDVLLLLYARTRYSFGKKYRLVYVTAAALLNQIEDTLPCLSIF